MASALNIPKKWIGKPLVSVILPSSISLEEVGERARLEMKAVMTREPYCHYNLHVSPQDNGIPYMVLEHQNEDYSRPVADVFDLDIEIKVEESELDGEDAGIRLNISL